MNYITQVERPQGRVTKIIAQVNGVNLSFIPGKDGKPREVSRTRGAMVYDQSSLYIPKAHYAGVIRQVCGILTQKPAAPKQLGFNFTKED
mgnify:FL=1